MFQCSQVSRILETGIEISCSQVSVGPCTFPLAIFSPAFFFFSSLLPHLHPHPLTKEGIGQFHPASPPQGSAPNSAGQELTAAPVEVYLLSPAPVPVANQRQHTGNLPVSRIPTLKPQHKSNSSLGRECLCQARIRDEQSAEPRCPVPIHRSSLGAWEQEDVRQT